MTELQDALETYDNSPLGKAAPDWVPVLAEAARKVADPDYWAAAERLDEEGGPIWTDIDIKPVIDAALGITEKT